MRYLSPYPPRLDRISYGSIPNRLSMAQGIHSVAFAITAIFWLWILYWPATGQAQELKDTCTISLKAPAASLLQDRGDILMATAKYGKGTVFAVVDPWIYNEYTDGRNLPPEYDNFGGAMELVNWLVKQVPRETSSPAGAVSRGSL